MRIVTAVRCAIKMGSKEADRKQAINKLKKDKQNAGRHVLGLHDLFSTDSCIKSTITTLCMPIIDI